MMVFRAWNCSQRVGYMTHPSAIVLSRKSRHARAKSESHCSNFLFSRNLPISSLPRHICGSVYILIACQWFHFIQGIQFEQMKSKILHKNRTLSSVKPWSCKNELTRQWSRSKCSPPDVGDSFFSLLVRLTLALQLVKLWKIKFLWTVLRQH